jgi:hypothetical protein
MIFNPTRSGGSEKEYTISVRSGVTTSATKLKPGHVFQATSSINRSPKMTFKDPDTGESVTINGIGGTSKFVMPCADVTISH